MRLLTLASIAAATGQTRSLPYSTIASSLSIPSEDVEMWVIDVIRAGLVEGKLSQLNQTFLIHRSTYRVFGDSQWREVAGRLDMWRSSLLGVLKVIQQEKENVIVQKERELREAESKVNGTSQNYRRAAQQSQREPIDVGLD
jgi:translation initiation factor 3 subunit M